MKALKFLLILAPVYFLISHVTLADSFVQRTIDSIVSGVWLTIALVMTLAIYYGMFLMFRGTLRWVGKQLNYERDNGK